MNLSGTGDCLTSWAIGSFSRRTLLREDHHHHYHRHHQGLHLLVCSDSKRVFLELAFSILSSVFLFFSFPLEHACRIFTEIDVSWFAPHGHTSLFDNGLCLQLWKVCLLALLRLDFEFGQIFCVRLQVAWYIISPVSIPVFWFIVRSPAFRPMELECAILWYCQYLM
jgi:hypothetical protein